MKRIVLLLVVIALFVGTLILGWTFRANNAGTVELDLIWIQLSDVPIWQLLIVAVAAGMALAGFVLGFAWLRARMLNTRYRALVKRLEAELHQMRSLPLSGVDEAVFEDEPVRSAAERS